MLSRDWLDEGTYLSSILLRHAPLRPFLCVAFGFLVVKKIYDPNSDSKYELGKVHVFFFLEGLGGGGVGKQG